MVKKHINTILTDLLFLMVAGYVLYEIATRFKAAGADTGGALTNAAFYPRGLAILILILASCNVAKNVYLAVIKHGAARDEIDSQPKKSPVGASGYLLTFGCMIWFWIYISLLESIGYVIATPVMLAGIFAALGVRKPLVNLAYSAGGTIGMYLFFQEMLDVILPVGLLSRWIG